MSALSIQVPFPVFQDRDGQPLDNGYVWIGEPNLNPQTNPVVAYYDEALTIIAAQPLRTINGYVSRSGAPAQIYVDGVNFSILVQDSKGSLVYSFAEGTGISADASGITYNPPFTGAVSTNVEAKLAQIVSAEDFGAYSSTDTAEINAAIAYAISSGARIKFSFPATIRVPEDAATLQQAFDAIYPDPTVGFLLTVSISSGYEIASGFLIANGDYGNIQLTSVDATVNVATSFAGINGGDGFCTNSLFVANKATAPRWSIFVDLQNIAGGLVYEQSKGFIAGSKGVTDSTEFGLYVKNQSQVFATNAIFTLSGYGNRVTVNSMFCAPQANFSGTKNELYVGTNQAANLDVSRGSVVYVTGSPGAETNLTGGAGRGLAVRRSFVSATNADCSGVAIHGLDADNGSVIAFDGSLANSCGQHGVVSAQSWVSFFGGSAINNGVYNIYAEAGGRIMARNATLTGGGTNGVIAANGSEIIATGANCRRNGVSDQNTDIAVSNGGYISAVNALGGTNAIPLFPTMNGEIIKATNSVVVAPRGEGDVTSFVDIDFQDVTTADVMTRFFRDTNTSGQRKIIVYAGDGTGTATTTLTSAGNLTIVGALSKGSGSFKIDHPLKPQTHHLVHSFIEGPQADNIYRGTVSLQAGKAVVNLDDAGRMTQGTFVALNCNVQCYTTNESGWSAVRGKVENNVLAIESQDTASADTISWMVIGERHDKHMKDADWTDADGRVITEPMKESSNG
jgi:hypothetical protein